MLFGALCICAGTVLGTMVTTSLILLVFVLIALIYLGLSVLYWFRIPTFGIALGTVCLFLAWFMYPADV